MTQAPIITPLITETTISLTRDNRYSFRVPREASKDQVRQQVEKLFKVNVLEINTMLIKEGNRRSLRNRKLRLGQTWKKATVKIKADQKIDLFDIANN